jgi:hypothetical protein
MYGSKRSTGMKKIRALIIGSCTMLIAGVSGAAAQGYGDYSRSGGFIVGYPDWNTSAGWNSPGRTWDRNSPSRYVSRTAAPTIWDKALWWSPFNQNQSYASSTSVWDRAFWWSPFNQDESARQAGGYGSPGYYRREAVPQYYGALDSGAAPLMTGRSVASGEPGRHCSTAAKTCMLKQASYVGVGCSCKVQGGRAVGSVTP